MKERTLAHGVVVTAVAGVVGTLFWCWAELNWKNVGGRLGVVAVALGGGVLAAFWAARMARRPLPIDWVFELVRTAMLVLLVSGVGALVTHLGDFNPGSPALANNQPNVSTPEFFVFMLGAACVGTSSLVPVWWHRHAVGQASPRLLVETLLVCGAWLGGAVALLAVFGRLAHFELSPRLFANPEAALCRDAGAEGLLRDPAFTPVTGYRAPGLQLLRVDCRTTAQYVDERLVVAMGRDAEGREFRGSELFVRVAGTPLERARAACEILLAGRCDAPLASPSELVGLGATLPEHESLVPRERAGRLLFLAVTREHPLGRQTKLGSRAVLVPHAVELATGRLVDAR